MNSILGKLIRDFRLLKGKLFLLVLAATLSAWGISSVTYSYYLSERDFRENFERTFPADMTMVIGNYQEGMDQKLKEHPNVTGIERREAMSIRIKSSQDSWMPLILYAIDKVDSMNYDRIRFPDKENIAADQFLIEQNAWNYLDEEKEEVEVLFPGMDEPVKWKTNGLVHDARQAPATMEGLVYGYLTSIERLEPFLPEGQRRLLIETNVSSNKEAIKLVSEQLKEIVRENGGEVTGVSIPEPGEHIHQGVIDGISFLQESGGITLSVMGIVLLALILLVWVYPQVSDIGVMKAIGASTKAILKSYLLALLLILCFGLLIGMPAGYKTASLYNKGVAFFQNFEVVERMLPLRTHIQVFLIATIIPFLVGMFPLVNASKTTVNEAISKTFYTSQKGLFRLAQGAFRGGQSQYLLNNLFRHGQRSLLTILLLMVGCGLFITASNVDHSIRFDLDAFAKTSDYEILVALPENTKKEALNFLKEVSSVENYLPVNYDRVSYISPSLGTPELITLRTFSPGVVIDPDRVVKGTLDKTCNDCLYISGEEMKKNFADAELGDPVILTFTSGEERKYIFSGVIDDLILIGAPFLAFSEETDESFNGLLFELKPGLTKQEMLSTSNDIDDAFLFNGINLAGRWSVTYRIGGIMAHLNPTFLIIKVMGIFTMILGLTGLLIVLNLTIRERTRETGIMKSIGASVWKITRLFTIEFLVLSSIAFVFGIIISIPIAKALIRIVAEVIIRHPVPLVQDINEISITALVVLGIQGLLVLVYSYYHMGKNARELLDHQF